MGRKVTPLVNTEQEAGYRSVQWNATDSFGKPVSAGVYFYQIRAGEFAQTRKMVLLK
jgi:flagellar hook assembly protein FlgD